MAATDVQGRQNLESGVVFPDTISEGCRMLKWIEEITRGTGSGQMKWRMDMTPSSGFRKVTVRHCLSIIRPAHRPLCDQIGMVKLCEKMGDWNMLEPYDRMWRAGFKLKWENKLHSFLLNVKGEMECRLRPWMKASGPGHDEIRNDEQSNTAQIRSLLATRTSLEAKFLFRSVYYLFLVTSLLIFHVLC